MTGTEALLGRGLAVPLLVSAAGLAESAGAVKIEESIRTILGTQHGERVMRPDFGCGLGRLAFAPNDAATANLARYYVAEGLTRWEPRIDVVSVDVENDLPLGRLVITLGYRIRVTGEPRTLVYPFSLEQSR
jgi:phage baseplate assembly protein W